MTATQLRRLCDDVYRDRAKLREFNPAMTERDAVFWVLYGSLASLLDAPDFAPADETDVYRAGVAALLRRFGPENLDWEPIIEDLSDALR